VTPIFLRAERRGDDRTDEDRTWTGWLLLTVSVVLTALLALTPSGYVIETPGPVHDTLGETIVGGEEVPLIDIPGQRTYETDGSLDLLTVSVVGNRDGTPDLLQVALSWFDPSKSVKPLDAVFPAGTTTQQRQEQAQLQMANSQQEAVAAALTELDYDIPRELTVATVLDDAPAAGVLEVGDRLVSVNGQTAADLPGLRRLLTDSGTDGPADIGIVRDGRELTESIVPTVRNGEVVVGVGVAVAYDFPFEVDIQLENVGGPSAGMMFALGIYDKLTPGALTEGATVAGTGTIDAQGAVGKIGGIRQKLYGASRAGATVFLAPEGNCDEVVGHVPGGLQVVAVETLDDAIGALEALAEGGTASGLPTCTAQ
jgi:PDZ domain-containing protein